MAQKRFPRTALALSAGIYPAGLYLVLFADQMLMTAVWVCADCLSGGQRLRDAIRGVVSVLPLALAVFLVTALGARDGRLVMDGVCTVEGLEAGLSAGVKILLLSVFARTCLVRFGTSCMLILLSWIFWPGKLFGLGPRLMARTVLRSLLLVPASVSGAFALLGRKPAAQVRIVSVSYPRRDTRGPVIAGSISLAAGLAMIFGSISLQIG